jgi:4-hydroxy-3-methylbut-2-enyl diphosphate reductase IspH
MRVKATCPLGAKVHSQGERHVQQGRLSVLIGHARAKNGSNSNWLREIAAETKIPAFLIADKTELDLDVLRGAKTIGLTAGASVAIQMAEAAVPRTPFADVLRLITELRPPPEHQPRKAFPCHAYRAQPT